MQAQILPNTIWDEVCPILLSPWVRCFSCPYFYLLSFNNNSIRRQIGYDVADVRADWELARKGSLGVSWGLSAVEDLPNAVEVERKRREKSASPRRLHYGFLDPSKQWRLEVRRRLHSEMQGAYPESTWSDSPWALCGQYGGASVHSNPCWALVCNVGDGVSEETTRQIVHRYTSGVLCKESCSLAVSETFSGHSDGLWRGPHDCSMGYSREKQPGSSLQHRDAGVEKGVPWPWIGGCN